MTTFNPVRRRTRQGARLHRLSPARTTPLHWLHAGRRSLGLLLLLGLGIVAVQQGQQLLDARKFPLRYIYLQGAWHYLDPAEVQQAVLSQSDASFFMLDIDQIQQHINAMPWVESATVQRHWPDSLAIQLKEREVFARWGETELIDPNGKRFQPAMLPESPEFKGWPLLNGPHGQELQVIELYQAAQARLQNVSLSVAKLEQDSRGAWRLQLDNGLQLRLGKIQLLARLDRFVVLYAKILQSQLAEITEVDLRYSNGLAVRWNRLTSSLPLASTMATRSAAAQSTRARDKHAKPG